MNLKKDIKLFLKEFPDFQFNEKKFSFIGALPIKDEKQNKLYEYILRIQLTKEYPYRFPIVFEIGNRIPKIIERHINDNNGSICLAVRPEEKLICTKGITLIEFVKNILLPHLKGQFLYDLGYKEFIVGGYPHYGEGLKEFYFDLFNTNNLDEVLLAMNLVTNNNIPNRNMECYCGSEVKFKYCHIGEISTLEQLGVDYLEEEIERLK